MTSAQWAIIVSVLSVLVNTGILMLFKRAFKALILEELRAHFPSLTDYTRDFKGMSDRVEGANAASQLSLQMAERATETAERGVQEAKATRDLLDRLHERVVQDFVEPIRAQNTVLQDLGRSVASLASEMETNTGLINKLLDRELKGP